MFVADEAGLASANSPHAGRSPVEERALLGDQASATRLSFAVLLKAFQFEGHFPERREEVVTKIVFHLANQTGVPPEAYFEEKWSEKPSAISAPRFGSTAVSRSSMPKMSIFTPPAMACSLP